jgi:hypothetical protein
MSSKSKQQARVATHLARTSAIAGALLLSACATAKSLDPQSAIRGKQLDEAVALYGPYDDQRLVNGHETYIWRRSILVQGHPYACELRAETAYRQMVSDTAIEGNVGACQAFWVRFSSSLETQKADKLKAAKAKVAANRAPNYRPVGRTPTTTTADVGGVTRRGAE